jgi:endonuclease/exonuclease/phosphatase family metal-dependent hydrolase
MRSSWWAICPAAATPRRSASRSKEADISEEPLTVRLGSWNIRFGRADDALVAEGRLDLLCLQEATSQAVGRFAAHFDWAEFGGDPAWLGKVKPCASHAPAVLGTTRFRATVRPPEDSLLAPDKLVAVDLIDTLSGQPLTVASYHAYAGEQGEDGLDKPRLTSQVAEWAEAETGPLILAMDANSPDIDHPDPAQVVCHFDQAATRHLERRLLHPVDAQHGLNDVLRTWLDAHPGELAQVQSQRAEGPLAVSHRTGRTALHPGDPRRYDHIYASPELAVLDVAYLYDDGIAAGSDHALVACELELGRA